MTRNQRLILLISILASFVPNLDGTVVNVALPAIAKNLGGGLLTQQWVVDAYLLSLGSVILIAGSISDVLGRKRILVYGLIGFLITSLLCTIAPNGEFLIFSRALQGLAGAFLVPSSLALIVSSFEGASEGKAIGYWLAWTTASYAIGPLVGGLLVDSGSWRLIFAINVIPIAITLWLLRRLHIAGDRKRGHVDYIGAIFCSLGLAGTVFALIEQPRYGWGNPIIWLPMLLGILVLAAFIWYEDRAKAPMLPLELFKIRNFSFGNLATTAIYAGLSIATFILVVFLQQVAHYSALAAGLAMVPVTILMFTLSPRFGALSGKFGPRWFMTGGPVVIALGFLLMLRVGLTAPYLTQVLPALLVFGLGLSITVAPLTTAVLGSIPSEHAGIASAVNNAIARIAGLVAIAGIGVIIGTLNLSGFHRAAIAMAGMLLVGALISAIGIRTVSPGSKA